MTKLDKDYTYICIDCKRTWTHEDDYCPNCASENHCTLHEYEVIMGTPVAEGNEPIPKCPECLNPCELSELKMFGGFCENCRENQD